MRRRAADVNLTRIRSIDRLETRRARRVMTRESPPRASGCPRPTAVGRTRGGASRPVMTRPEPSTPRPHVLRGQNLPCPLIDDGPYIQKTTSSYIHRSIHRPLRYARPNTCTIYRSRGPPREAARRGRSARQISSFVRFHDRRRPTTRVRDSRATNARARRDSRARTRVSSARP